MIGVIYFAYGAPKSMDDVSAYFSHILNGREVPAAVMTKVVNQFKGFGTSDPLAAATYRQAKGLEQFLQANLEENVKVYNAYKHTAPFVVETIRQMIADGVTTIVTLTVNPVFSKTGTGAFEEEVAQLVSELGPEVSVVHVNGWNTNKDIVSVYATRVRQAYDWLTKETRENAIVLFTVHSQPINPENNEIYVKQYTELAEAIVKEAGILNWKAVYRSAANKETWLGPDVKDAIRELTAAGSKGFVTCELLSLAADVESFYEIGSDCKAVCDEIGAEFVQAEFPSDSYDAVVALGKIVIERVNVEVVK